jgi:trk system potassium uptake protein TrkH
MWYCLFEAISGFTTTEPASSRPWRTCEEYPVLALVHTLDGRHGRSDPHTRPASLARRAHPLPDGAESPGPISSKLVPKVGQSSKILLRHLCRPGPDLRSSPVRHGLPSTTPSSPRSPRQAPAVFSVRNLSIASYGNPPPKVVISVL